MKRTGVSTGGVETSARYKRKMARRRRAEEAGWVEQNGPLVVHIAGYVIWFKQDVAKADIKAAMAKIRAAVAAGEPIEDGGELYSVRPGS